LVSDNYKEGNWLGSLVIYALYSSVKQ